MSENNPFGFDMVNPFGGDTSQQFEDDYMVEPLNNFEWNMPQEIFEEKPIFAPAEDFPWFNCYNKEKDQEGKNFKQGKSEKLLHGKTPEKNAQFSDAESAAGVKLV